MTARAMTPHGRCVPATAFTSAGPELAVTGDRDYHPCRVRAAVVRSATLEAVLIRCLVPLRPHRLGESRRRSVGDTGNRHVPPGPAGVWRPRRPRRRVRM
jgi:hypothetical protein